MRIEHEAMMVVRADLCDRIEALQRLAGRRRGRDDVAGSIAAIHRIAAAYGLTPVARLAEAMQRALLDRELGCPTALYLDRLHDAIGCARNDEQAGEAMIASVSVRLTA